MQENIPKGRVYDAVIVGSGPNGLAAAITLAQKGLSVVILEAQKTIGGGLRSAKLTLPGFTHDICSAVHPLAVASPFFRTLPLSAHGLEWIQPHAPLAHPYDNGKVVILERSVDQTIKMLESDAQAYKKLMNPFVADWDDLAADILGPLHFPKHPLTVARFGWYGIQSAIGLAKEVFTGELARGLFAGLAAHSIMPLEKTLTASFGLVLGILGHKVGWPIAQGGSQRIANALASYFRSLGGEIVTGINVTSMEQLPVTQAILFDVTPGQLLSIVGNGFPSSYRKRLTHYRYGPGVFKVDWALSSPIPWKSPECLRAGTVHVGGTMEEIALGEREVSQGRLPQQPFVLLAQPSLFDSTRAPSGKHTAWAYCHVPNGSSFDMTERIETQIERFAPHFRDCILARSTRSAIEMEQYNQNYRGGDINGGMQDLFQLFTRPVARLDPYSTPKKNVYICSSSTPPGGGVHGMCGYFAAQSALKHCF